MKPFYQSKTIWFNVLSTIVVVLSLPEVQTIIPVEYSPYVAIAIALGNMNLRSITAGGLSVT